MSITLEEVRHVAKLARLELDESEILSLQGELNALLGHFSDIQGIDVGNIVPTSHAVSLQNVWANDAVGPVLHRDDALRNSALTKAGLFVVPQIIED
ncbi:MAG: Asp-tRNA(Asn)/Glu-tRNA(Gln) amidotransferase subunit GatC [Fimbriimonadaceae bacterium]|nr:Asp-tRNA(Asn)/Glu-tRNA(Gln) amidotransferase subunit GatC [Fimbriimonadaceae bacterium]